jgi:hypothetical protein
MTTLEQALRERLNKLDADFAKHQSNYTHHRAALLAAIQYESGSAVSKPDNEPNMASLKPAQFDGHLMAASRTDTFFDDLNASNQLVDAENRRQMEWVKVAITAVASTATEFTKNDVRAKLKEIQPKISPNVIKNMSSFLWRLHREGKLIRVKVQGQGHTQSIYEKIGS